jgi:RNA polymerase sigma-54 factor
MLASDVLERSNEEVAALIGHHEDANPCIKRVTRVRRQAPSTSQLIDRLPAPNASLAEHLGHQLATEVGDPRMLGLALWVVGNLDPDGYLRDNLAELASLAGCSLSELQEALVLVQSLDPIGVGARSLRECLLLQLRARIDADPVAVQLVDDHLEALSQRRYGDLARVLGQPVDRVLRAVATIRRLEPRPGRPFGDAPAPAVRPEVAIERAVDGYRVIVRDEDVPRLRVSRPRWVEAAMAPPETRGYLVHRIRAASLLVTALERRRQTLHGVVESIIRRQPDFLEHGPSRLRPLSLRQVALDVGVHESTVSRAVAHRYVDTPHGVLPLRSFFTNGLPGDPAGVVSALAARLRIRELIEAEDPVRPLADRKIALALAAVGIRVARRTVMKYREILGIAPASRRKALAVALAVRGA